MSSHLINLKKRMGFMNRRDIDKQKVIRLADQIHHQYQSDNASMKGKLKH